MKVIIRCAEDDDNSNSFSQKLRPIDSWISFTVKFARECWNEQNRDHLFTTVNVPLPRLKNSLSK